METIKNYLNYVQSALNTIPRDQAVTSYDTGYNLHVVDTYLGREVHCMDVMAHSILKIRSPQIECEDWYIAWSQACDLVKKYCEK